MLDKLLGDYYFDDLNELLLEKMKVWPLYLTSCRETEKIIGLLSDFKEEGTLFKNEESYSRIILTFYSDPFTEMSNILGHKYTPGPKIKFSPFSPELNFTQEDLVFLKNDYLDTLERIIQNRWFFLTQEQLETYQIIKKEKNIRVLHDLYNELIRIPEFSSLDNPEELTWAELPQRLPKNHQSLEVYQVLHQMTTESVGERFNLPVSSKMITKFRDKMIRGLSNNMFRETYLISFSELQRLQEVSFDPNVEVLFLEYQKFMSM